MIRFWTVPILIQLAFWETLLAFNLRQRGHFRRVRNDRGEVIDFARAGEP